MVQNNLSYSRPETVTVIPRTRMKLELKPYPVPKSQEARLKAEIQHLEKQQVLQKANHTELGMPAFTILKKME